MPAIWPLSSQLLTDKDNSRSILGLSVGVIGPGAVGEEIQNGFHHLIGDTTNKGWGYQLKNEPAFELLGQPHLPAAARQFQRASRWTRCRR